MIEKYLSFISGSLDKCAPSFSSPPRGLSYFIDQRVSPGSPLRPRQLSVSGFNYPCYQHPPRQAITERQVERRLVSLGLTPTTGSMTGPTAHYQATLRNGAKLRYSQPPNEQRKNLYHSGQSLLLATPSCQLSNQSFRLVTNNYLSQKIAFGLIDQE